jgi:hypothetical protein
MTSLKDALRIAGYISLGSLALGNNAEAVDPENVNLRELLPQGTGETDRGYEDRLEFAQMFLDEDNPIMNSMSKKDLKRHLLRRDARQRTWIEGGQIVAKSALVESLKADTPHRARIMEDGGYAISPDGSFIPTQDLALDKEYERTTDSEDGRDTLVGTYTERDLGDYKEPRLRIERMGANPDTVNMSESEWRDLAEGTGLKRDNKDYRLRAYGLVSEFLRALRKKE